MLKGKQLILATRQFAKENRTRSWVYTLSTLLFLCICLAGTLINFHIAIRIVISIFSGLLIVRMFVIYHDYVHEAILQHSLLAKCIFTLFGMYVLAPTGIWRRSHNHHHNHNSKLFSASIGSYPVFTKSKFEKCSSWEKRRYLIIRHPITILFGYLSTFMYGMCIQSMINSFRKHVDSLYALLLHFSVQCIILYFFLAGSLFCCLALCLILFPVHLVLIYFMCSIIFQVLPFAEMQNGPMKEQQWIPQAILN